jgi:hypothetical protein
VCTICFKIHLLCILPIVLFGVIIIIIIIIIIWMILRINSDYFHINQLIYVMEARCVFFEVGTKSLNTIWRILCICSYTARPNCLSHSCLKGLMTEY